MSKTAKSLVLWLVVALVLVSIFNVFGPRAEPAPRINFSDFINEVSAGNVKSITVSGSEVNGTLNDDKPFSTYLLQPLTNDSALTKDLLDKKVVIKSRPEETPGLLFHLLNLLPWILLLVIFFYVSNNRKDQSR